MEIVTSVPPMIIEIWPKHDYFTLFWMMEFCECLSIGGLKNGMFFWVDWAWNHDISSFLLGISFISWCVFIYAYRERIHSWCVSIQKKYYEVWGVILHAWKTNFKYTDRNTNMQKLWKNFVFSDHLQVTGISHKLHDYLYLQHKRKEKQHYVVMLP